MNNTIVKNLVYTVFLFVIFFSVSHIISSSFSQSTNISDILKYTGSQFENSPLVNENELKDNYGDAIFLINSTNSGGSRAGEILSVNYFSEGNFLTAIIWLVSPLNERSIHYLENYGMYLDSDFNIQTGYGGIDSKMEISWNSSTQSWYKT
jgi:hypothetical protein